MMPELRIASPEGLGIDPDRLAHADALLDAWAQAGAVPAAGRCLGIRGKIVAPRAFGRQRLDAPGAVRDDALWLVASITKPIVVAGAMQLVEQGRLGLDDRVAEYVPEFAAHDKSEVRIRHLMTHTSGLPDQLPNNPELRAAHADLPRFVRETCQIPLLFPPGTRVRYQSMGTLMLAEVVQRIADRPIADQLREHIFGPLGMADTSLGTRPGDESRVVELRVDPEMVGKDWNWNSPYWLALGSPWGGLVTTPADLARFALAFLGGGAREGRRILSAASVAAMTRNQLEGFPGLPEEDRRCRPWGLGWRLAWPGRSDNAGDLFGPGSYGHWGATGTLLWIDPEREAFLVLLTTEPSRDEGRFLARAANAYNACLP